MKIISLIYNEKKNAGPKAPADINEILKKEYKAKEITILKKGMYKIKLLFVIFSLILTKDIIVIQYPLVHKRIIYRFLNKNKSIILIHDINGLRNQNEEILKKEIDILNMFKYIIVHNLAMKDFLISNNISEDKIYNLEVFDYLANGKINETNRIEGEKITVLYPGNLKKEKSPFIYQIDSKKLNFKLNLYGLGLDKNVYHNDNIKYMGSFEPKEISNLEGDLGLIWDGNYDESDENITFKNYTKYNNSHKLSCCLAIGIPVIVWEKAAISDFVKKNNVGYTINNIYDINNLDFSDYYQKKANAIIIGKKMRDGFYTKKVLKDVLKNMEEI